MHANAPVTPGTPNSTGATIAAGTAAHDRRRDNKTIMECFRDRTPGYTRYNSRVGASVLKYEQSISYARPGDGAAVIYLKEPRRPNKLALLKSASTRDLSRLMEEAQQRLAVQQQQQQQQQQPQHGFNSNSSTSTNSSSSTSVKSVKYKLPINNVPKRNNHTTQKDIQKLTERITALEQQFAEQCVYTKDLEQQLQALTKQLEDLSEKQVERRKKPFSKKEVKESSAVAGGVAGNIVIQPSKFVAWMNLSNLWKHRPSIETLKEQNIYNDEPCFDTEIELVLKHEIHKTIPKIVVDCCDLIEEKYRKSAHAIEGIYRQCGDYNKIQTLRFRIDANDYESLRQQNVDIHTLTGVLKLFLREIKSPLVSTNEAKTFIGKPNQWLLTELPNKIELLKRLIRSLPEINRDTMEYLFAHFNKLTKVPLQQVSAETLSLSVTPSIFHTVQQDVHMQDIHVLLKESEILADCVKIMIEYQSRIFESTAERRQRRISMRKLRKTLSHPDLLFQNIF